MHYPHLTVAFLTTAVSAVLAGKCNVCGTVKLPETLDIDFRQVKSVKDMTTKGLVVTDTYQWRMAQVGPNGESCYGQASNLAWTDDGLDMIFKGSTASDKNMTGAEFYFDAEKKGITSMQAWALMRVPSEAGTSSAMVRRREAKRVRLMVSQALLIAHFLLTPIHRAPTKPIPPRSSSTQLRSRCSALSSPTRRTADSGLPSETMLMRSRRTRRSRNGLCLTPILRPFLLSSGGICERTPPTKMRSKRRIVFALILLLSLYRLLFMPDKTYFAFNSKWLDGPTKFREYNLKPRSISTAAC